MNICRCGPFLPNKAKIGQSIWATDISCSTGRHTATGSEIDASRLLRYLLGTREIEFVVAKTFLRPCVAEEKGDDRRIALGDRATTSRSCACHPRCPPAA